MRGRRADVEGRGWHAPRRGRIPAWAELVVNDTPRGQPSRRPICQAKSTATALALTTRHGGRRESDGGDDALNRTVVAIMITAVKVMIVMMMMILLLLAQGKPEAGCEWAPDVSPTPAPAPPPHYDENSDNASNEEPLNPNKRSGRELLQLSNVINIRTSGMIRDEIPNESYFDHYSISL